MDYHGRSVTNVVVVREDMKPDSVNSATLHVPCGTGIYCFRLYLFLRCVFALIAISLSLSLSLVLTWFIFALYHNLGRWNGYLDISQRALADAGSHAAGGWHATRGDGEI